MMINYLHLYTCGKLVMMFCSK